MVCAPRQERRKTTTPGLPCRVRHFSRRPTIPATALEYDDDIYCWIQAENDAKK